MVILWHVLWLLHSFTCTQFSWECHNLSPGALNKLMDCSSEFLEIFFKINMAGNGFYIIPVSCQQYICIFKNASTVCRSSYKHKHQILLVEM